MQKIVSKKIPNKLYREIYRLMPIFCVDLIVTDRTGRYFFLVKRANKPEKGKWWFPGGRVHKNELMEQAVARKLKEETGLSGTIVRQVGLYEYRSSPRDGFFKGVNVHTPIMVHVVRANTKQSIALDTQSSDGVWFKKIDRSWTPYVKEYLKKGGF